MFRKRGLICIGQTLQCFTTRTYKTYKESSLGIIEFSAKEGFERLKWVIDSGEGLRYIGEVAIENVLTARLKNGHSMTMEEREEKGVNNSMMYLDIMIGSEQLQINDERVDGTMIPIFIDGA